MLSVRHYDTGTYSATEAMRVVAFMLLSCCGYRSVFPSDERPDVGHDEVIHPNAIEETHILDLDIHTGQDIPHTHRDTDWEINTDMPTTPKAHILDLDKNRCQDIFRCQEGISKLRHDNRSRKQQLEEVKPMMSELQEQLTNHQHQIQALETQNGEIVGVNWTLDQSLRSLELRRSETVMLLHVHATLLNEMKTQLSNMSAAVQTINHNTDCNTHNVIKTTQPPGLGMQHTRTPDQMSFCSSDCASLFQNGVRHSGVYVIALSPGVTTPVYCDMETEGGGWTVFQRRRDGTVSFNRRWSEYREGFGEARAEHWLGNTALHVLSNRRHCSLRIELTDWTDARRHAQYHTFRVEEEERRFRLHVSGFSGSVSDSFGSYHDGQPFSTPDTGHLCSEVSHAGWWFNQCFHANLNGVYYKGGRYSLKASNSLGPDGIVWFSWKNSDFYSLKAVTMMIRPQDFRP